MGSVVRQVHAGLIRVVGELDIATEPQLTAAVREALDAGEPLVLDLSATTFLDAAGLGALIALRNHARAHHRTLTITAPSPAVQRLLHLTGLHTL